MPKFPGAAGVLSPGQWWRPDLLLICEQGQVRCECPSSGLAWTSAAPQLRSDSETLARHSVGKCLQRERPDSGLDEQRCADVRGARP